MHNYGLTKVVEECGELIQVIAKIQAYPDIMRGDTHPDGVTRVDQLVEELGDVMAAIQFVVYRFGFEASVGARAAEKKATFLRWDADPNS